MQIHKDAEQLGVFTGLYNAVVFGGMDHEKQRRSLDRPIDIIIGTPGRVIDYSRGGSLDLSQVEVLVIDEADRMLDMGFIPDVKRIVTQLPRKGERQTLLFSATLDEHILRLTSGWLAEPVIVESEPEKMVSENIEQTFYSVLREEKLALTLYLLAHEPYDRVLIFGNRKDVNLRLQYDLARYGYQVPVLSGDIPQEKRDQDPRAVPRRHREGGDRHRRRRPRHPRRRRLAGDQLRPAGARGGLCPPHRPHRTRRPLPANRSVFLCEYGAYYLPDIEKLLDVRFSSILPTEEMLKLPEPVQGAKLPQARAGGGPAQRTPRRIRARGRGGRRR